MSSPDHQPRLKIISLGYTCYIKSLLNQTKYMKDTDIFDWMNSFSFSKLVKSLDNGFNIFDGITRSHLDVDTGKGNVFFSERYMLRLPHEHNLITSIVTYKRRYERFKNYKNINDKYVFIRIMNIDGRYGIEAEDLIECYGEENYNNLMKHLPPSSRVLLITHHTLSDEQRPQIYEGFEVYDNVFNPENVAFGDKMKYKGLIINQFNLFLTFLDKNFNIRIPELRRMIGNELLTSVEDENTET